MSQHFLEHLMNVQGLCFSVLRVCDHPKGQQPHARREGNWKWACARHVKNPREFEIDEQGIYFQKLQNHLQMFKLFMIFYLKQRLGGTTKYRATSIVCADCPQRR